MERVEGQVSGSPSTPPRGTPLSAIFRAILVPVAAVVVALLIGAIIIALSGANPLRAYIELFKGGLGSPRAIQRTLERTTPLIFGGLAVSLAFKAGFFNIGAQGQLLFGAIFAAYIGFTFKGMLPTIIHLPLALLIGGLVGGLYAAIPGVLRAYSGAHEVITTIMLNYVAYNMTDYLANGPWKDRSPGNIVARTPSIGDTAKIPAIGNIPLGVVLAFAAAFIVWWLINKSTLGFELRTVGQNPNAAKYAGISVQRITVLALMLSGVLAGLGGAVETLGVNGRFQPGFSGGLGFTAITIALLARTNPIGVIPAALLIGAMQAGGSPMQFNAKVAVEIIDVIQALILFFVAADVLIRKLLRLRGDDGGIKLSSGWGA